MASMLQIDAAQVAARLDRRALIDALDDAFRRPHQVPERQHYAIDAAQPGQSSGTLLMMPAWDTGPVPGVGAALGIKVVTVFPDNALRGLPTVCASYLLLDAATGQARAIIDGGELTLRRTAAASALASRHLSSPDAARLLMVGTGMLAPHLVESHVLVRQVREVRIWGRRADRAQQLAASLARTGLSVEATEDLEASTRWADIVSCATLSQQPLVLGAWLRPGQHLDLVGAFTPQMREADDEAIARCALYVDTRSGAMSESGEITGAIARGIIDQNAIRAEFADLSAGTFARRDPRAITLFKSVGTALEDLVAAKLVFAATGTPSILTDPPKPIQ
jgi:alanine dehydrogenase